MSQKEQEFFKELENKIEEHPLHARLTEELKEHLEDSALSKRESIDQSIGRLGKPAKIAGELKEIYFSFKRFVVYILVYFAILSLLSLIVSLALFGKPDPLTFASGFAPFFAVVVSPLTGFIFGYSKNKLGYSQKEILFYGMGIEIIKALIVAALMIFTNKLYFMFDPDVKPYLPHLFLIMLFLGGFCSWVGGVIGHVFGKNSVIKNPPMIGA